MEFEEARKAAIEGAFRVFGSSAGAYGYLFDAGAAAARSLSNEAVWTNIQTHGLPSQTRRYWITTNEGEVMDAMFYSKQQYPFFTCDGVRIGVIAWAEYSTPEPYSPSTGEPAPSGE